MQDAQTPLLRGYHDAIHPHEYALSQEISVIGREPPCDVLVCVSTVSRRHAQIRRDGPRCWISDAGSANGTFINGERIDEPHLLEDGDEIRLGPEVHFRFADPNPTEKAISSLYFDQKRRLFMVGQQPLKLAQREFRLLDYLYQHQGLVCSYDSCIHTIWGDDHLGDDDRRLGQAVYSLRKHLREAGLQVDDLIKTVKGEGYQLTL